MVRKITVETSDKYDVITGENISCDIPEFIEKICSPEKILIVTDDIVAKLYLEYFTKIFEKNGKKVYHFVFPHGEKSKTFSCVGKILKYLAENHFEKSDIIAALGGGIPGDIGGFAASCYLRGIKYFQIPTTLLAAVDSSVGGKTAVNLPQGKNLAGAFYQPSATFCDTNLMKTLSDSEFSQGLAEVIKYGMLFDEDIISAAEKEGSVENIRANGSLVCDIVEKCVRFKADTVKKDEFDKGERHLLNFGHTVGHGIEKSSGYKIHHGSGVAIGMCAMTSYAEKEGICVKRTYKRLSEVLEKCGLPVKTSVSTEKILDAVKYDKKASDNRIKIILPKKIGECFIKEVGFEELDGIIKEGFGE